MRAQEVVTLFSDIPQDGSSQTYHQLEIWFSKGMYIETFVQTQYEGKYVITFLLRYYNTTISQDKK